LNEDKGEAGGDELDEDADDSKGVGGGSDLTSDSRWRGIGIAVAEIGYGLKTIQGRRRVVYVRC
jgi:hypothetical protein